MQSNPVIQSAAPASKRKSGQSQPRRRWLPYVAVAALISAITAGFWPKPVLVEISRVSVGPIRSTVNEEARTRVRQRFTVASPVMGQSRRISLKPGDKVRGGETVLAVVDPISPALLDDRNRALTAARLNVAVSNLEKARSAFMHALSELRRFQKLHGVKAISDQELEAVTWRATAAEKDQTASEAVVRQVEAELAEFTTPPDSGAKSIHSPTEIKSPITGRVLRVFEESSRVVGPGAPLLEIGDPNDLEIVIEVLSRDSAMIPPGAKVELEHWGGDQPLSAKVRHVEPSAFTKVSALGVEEQRVNVIADLIDLPENRPSLGDHFRVEARLIIWETDRALKVPTGALFRQRHEWAAYVVVNGRAELRSVKAGRSSGEETHVVEGLKEGDEVILYPGDRIHDGLRVKPIRL